MRHSHKQPQSRPKPSIVPYLLMLGGVVLLGLTAFLFWRGNASPKAAIEVKGSPALKADKESVDLGEVKLGQTVQVSFQISNAGDKPLRFTEKPYVEVKEGC